MRDTTERPEAVEAGTVKLVGTDVELIVSETNKLLANTEYYHRMSEAHNPYGDGSACQRILDALVVTHNENIEVMNPEKEASVLTLPKGLINAI
jgi:UDP-N-acetylglucosamine 2-epimerase (non-hydrolysing)